MTGTSVIKGETLSKDFSPSGFIGRDRGYTRAVTAADIMIDPGDRVALVGESGSGKTTLGRMLLALIKPTAGRVLYRGRDVNRLDRQFYRRYRRACQMVFQDPQSSLNPRRRVGAVLAEVIERHGSPADRSAEDRVIDLLGRVGLRPEARQAYPHQLSGGQRQRVGIARALAADPELIVADEPVSSLDVSVRGGILRLLLDLSRDRNMACLLITHDLEVARNFALRVMVMYRGVILESGLNRMVFERPLHPYTKCLLSAVPRPIPGYLPPVEDWRKGFSTFTTDGQDRIRSRRPESGADFLEPIPPMVEVRPGHFVRRLYLGDDTLRSETETD